MKIAYLYSGDDGESHFRDIDIPTPNGEALPMAMTEHGYMFTDARERPPRGEGQFHNASRRQFVITLGGVGEIELGDGTKRQFHPGDIMLADDLQGRGHITRDLEPRIRLVIPVPLDFDVAQWPTIG